MTRTRVAGRRRHGSAGLSRQDAGAGVKLHFRSARLDTVLDHLHDCAGVFIHANSNVPTEHTIDLWQDEPVSAAEALSLLKRVLVDMGCTADTKGRALQHHPKPGCEEALRASARDLTGHQGAPSRSAASAAQPSPVTRSPIFQRFRRSPRLRSSRLTATDTSVPFWYTPAAGAAAVAELGIRP